MNAELVLDSRNDNDRSLIRYFKGSSNGHMTISISDIEIGARLKSIEMLEEYNSGSMEYCIYKVILEA